MSKDTSHSKNFPALVIGAIGVVFGDIGTSPLYAVRESFHAFNLPTDQLHIYGVMSLVFWLLLIIVSVKYLLFVMRADNKGEGGNLALLALAKRLTRGMPKLNATLITLGIIGGALFFSDAVITPAISVLSAIEGLEIVQPALHPYIIPIALVILTALFAVQKHGTSVIGKCFGPIMLVWFTTIGVLGAVSIMHTPEILRAVNPLYAVAFFVQHPLLSFWCLGAAVLAVTGAEALYADMGHFSKKAIQCGWFIYVWPCLLLNYFGQAALLIRVPQAITNPFYLLAPDWAMMPLLILAAMATVIASQAVITGTYSVTRQAIFLGYLPRLRILHTSDETKGQIYMPMINWLLCAIIFIIVISFKTSSALAAAYGLAITGNMIITALIFMVVARLLWKWKMSYIVIFGVIILTIETALFSANFIKLLHGAWLPIAMSAIIYLLCSTWQQGQKLLQEQNKRSAIPPESYVSLLEKGNYPQVSGTAFYLTRQRGMVPASFLVQLRHTKVLHEQVVFLTVQIMDTPYVTLRDRCEYTNYGKGFHRIVLHYGFKETPNLKDDLELCRVHNFCFNWKDSSFFLGSENIVPKAGHGMPLWRDMIFMLMKRNSGEVLSYLNLPHDRVVELKSQHIV